ncbi:23387_t:CDS:1, partial [Gigaspora rosea]
HIWVENWGYYKSNDLSPENYQRAANFMLGFLQNRLTEKVKISLKALVGALVSDYCCTLIVALI